MPRNRSLLVVLLHFGNPSDCLIDLLLNCRVANVYCRSDDWWSWKWNCWNYWNVVNFRDCSEHCGDV